MTAEEAEEATKGEEKGEEQGADMGLVTAEVQVVLAAV